MASPTAMNPLIRAIRRRLNFAIGFNHALRPVCAVLGTFALALLVCKLLRPEWARWTPWLLAGLVPALAYAWVRARRSGAFFGRADVVEVIDHLYLDDGSVTTAEEQPGLVAREPLHAAVAQALAQRMPRLQPGYYLGRVLPVFSLLVVALAFPPRQPASAAQAETIVASLTQPLFDKLAETEPVLPEEARQELQTALETLRESKQGISREKWEAIEELERRIDEAAQQSQQSLADALSALNKAAGMVQAAPNIGGDPEAARQAEALMKDLQQTLNAGPSKLPEGLKKEISNLAGQMRQMDMEELRKRMQELQQKMPCCASGQCSGQGCCDGSGPCNGNGNGKDGEGKPGSGGINRGRADAALTLGEEQTAQGAAFQQQDLQNQFLSPQDLVDLGVTPLQPKPEPGKFSPGTLRQFEATEGSAVNRTAISPGQKDAVARYFSDQAD